MASRLASIEPGALGQVCGGVGDPVEGGGYQRRRVIIQYKRGRPPRYLWADTREPIGPY